MEKTEEKVQSKHFSHGHQLEYTTKLPPEGNAICSGCKFSIFPDKFYYRCETCSYFLHQVCFKMPKNLEHLVDPIYHLTLLAMPSSSIHDSTRCKACGKEITGFSYTCAKCYSYYHTLCLALPLTLKLPSHCHTLDLEFCPPYDFECDLCKKPSYKGWLYHCSSCEFDAHISCAITHKGEDIHNPCESIYQSKSSDQALEKETKIGSKCHELTDLLSKYMKGTEESISQKSFQDHVQLQVQQQTPSYQFSDGCFSIDLAKSQLLNDEQMRKGADYHAVEIAESKEKQNVAYATLTKGVNLSFSNGIGSEVWMGLGREMEKAYQTNDSHKERLRSSCCPDILKSLFCPKK